MPQTFDYMGALREGYTPKEIKRFVKGLDQQNDLEQRGAKFVQKQARQREAVNSMMENSRSRASAGLTPAQTLYPAGVTRDPIGQDIQNTAAAPNVPRPTGIVRAENVAPDLVSAFEQAPESSLGDATSGYLSEAPNVKLRGARGIVQGVKDAPKAAWLGLNQAASAGMQAIGDVVQEDIGILTKAAKATSDLLTLNMSPTEIPADTGSNVIQQVGRDAYAVHTQGMQELSDKYAPDSWGGAVMNAGAQAGQQLGILGTAAAIGIRNPAAMTNFSLGALGAQSGLTEYGDARAKGFDVPRSLLKAGVGGGMEVVTEVAPMGKLVNFMSTPAKKGVAAFLKDAAEYGLQDIGGELLNTMITDVVNNKMQARPNMTPQEQADEVSRYFSSGEWKQAAATTFKQAVLQSGIMMGAAKGVQHLDGKIRGEQDPLTDGATFQPQNLPPVNPERQGRVDKLAGIMANESERTAQMRLNIANQRRSQQSVTAPPAQQIEQVAPEAVQPVVPVAESAQPQEIPAQIAPAAEAPVAPVATPSPEAASAPEQDAEAIAPELADLLRRKTNLEKAIFTADGTEKKTATKRMKDNYAALTATITALQPQNPEQEVVSNGQQAEPETATEQGAVATDTAGGTGGTAPADETGMGSAEAMPGGTVSGVDEQSGDGMPVLRPQPDVAEAPQATPDIMALVDGKSDDQIQKTIDMVRGLNPERAGQIEAYWKSKATPVPEPQTGQEPAPAAQDGRESVPPAGDATQKEDPLDSQQRETAEVTPIPAGRKERIEKMIERHGGLDKIPPAWREQWDRINEQEAEQQGDTAQKQPWDAAAFMAEMEKEQARSDAAHERAYQLETPEVQDAQAKYENGTIDIDEFEKQLDQAQAGSAKEQTTFQDMVREAARWKGAALNAEAALGDDKKARLAHSRMTTKADLDAYLMRKFGVDDVTARSVSNELTAKNVPADKSAQPAEFAGETWAHTPQPQQGKIGGKLAQGEVVLTATGRSTTPFPKVDTSTNGKAGNTFKRVDQWLMDNAIEEARSRGDEFNLRQLEANRDKPTQADKDSAEMYLFGEEQPPVPKPFLKPLVTPSEDQGKAVATSGPSASTAKEVAQEDTPSDLKGFDYKPGDGGDFSITKGNLTVKAASQGNGKYQASRGSATSSPHMDKQTVVYWADNIVKESQRTDKGRGQAGSATQPPPLSPIAAHDDFIKRLDEGSATPDDLKASFASLQENRDAIKAELGKLKKDDLLNRLGRMEAYRYKNDKKETVVNAVFRRMLSSHNLSGTIQYNPMEKGAMDAALKAKVDATTERDIADHAEQVKAAREDAKERIEGLVKSAKNPETWDEFQTFIRMHKDKGGINALTPEQRKRYDELHAEHNKETAAKQVERKATVREAGEQVDSEIIETTHTKTGDPLFVVKAADRVGKDVYKEWNATAKKLGGWYSSYRAGGAVPGFQFKTRESAESFKQYLKGDASTASETIKERIEERQESKKQSAADKLAALADSMEEKASGVLNADRLTNTAKRAQQAESTDASARKTIALATTIRNIARAIQEGEAKHLEGISAGTHIETLDAVLSAAKYTNLRENGPSGWSVSDERYRMPNESDMDYVEYPYPNPHQDHIKEIGLVLREKSGAVKDGEWLMKRYAVTSSNDSSVITFMSPPDIERLESVLAKAKKVPRLKSAVENVTERMAKYKRLQKMGIPDEPTLRAALREYLQFKDEGPKADKAKQLERQLAGNKNVGIDFFPTPPAVAADLVERAGIAPGMKVLEPSGGTGNIAEEIRGAGADVDVAEISQQMRDLLEAKGFNLVARDFMDFDEGGYDAIVMNPPFSADIEHVRHAFDLLKPGGRLVAIVGEGSFGNQKKHTEFQEWLDEHGATVEKLPQGTFADRTQLKTTGANARVVEMVKRVHAEVAPTFSKLTPAGKRGSVQAYTVHLSPSQAMSLKEIRQEVSDGEAGGRAGIYNERAPGTTQVSWGSSFPEYFQNKGLTKKQVLPVLDRIIAGQPVTEAQWLIAEDMLKAKRYDTLNRILNERQERRIESLSELTDDQIAEANDFADEFFSQFDGTADDTATSTGGLREDDSAGSGRDGETSGSEEGVSAPATVAIDESGWGQQVAPELQGSKKAVSFGDKEQAGRTVGLSEFMDGFTPDPQQGLFGGTVTLDSMGLQQIYERLANTKLVKDAMADLKRLGGHVYAQGNTAWKPWFQGMKDSLGKLFRRFRPTMEKLYATTKSDVRYSVNNKGGKDADSSGVTRREGLRSNERQGNASARPHSGGLSQYADSEYESHAERVRRLAEIISEDLGGEPVVLSVARQGSETDDGRRVSGALGRELIYVTNHSKSIIDFHGVVFDDKTIFVEESTPLPHMVVIGHELLHSIKLADENNGTSHYNDFANAIKKEVELNGYLAYAKDKRAVLLDPEVAPEMVYEEVLGDFIGDRLTDKDFWNKIFRTQPSLARRVMQSIKTLIEKAKGHFKKTDAIFKDLQKAENMAAYFLSRHMRRVARGTVAAEDNAPASPKFSLRTDRTGDPRVDAVLDKIGSPDKTLADRIKDSLGNLAHKETRMREIEQGFFDRYASLRYLDKMAGITGPDDSAYISARMSTSFSDVMYAMVHHGHPIWKDGGSAVSGKGLMEIFKPVADELDVFMGWMVGARAQKLMNEGRERYFDQDEINILKGLKTPDNSARWEKVRRDYMQYKKQVLDFAEQAGVINPEARRIWDHEEYVPFYRVVEDKPKGPFKVKGLASQNSGIRTLKGADERLGDIFENIIQNFSHLTDAAIKNRATELAVQKAEQIGAATPAPLEWKAVKIGNQQVVDAVHEFFGETQDDIDAFVNPEEMEAFTTFFHPAKPMGKDVIHVLRDGKPQYYQVHDDLLLRSMTSINEQIWGGPAMTFMRFVKRLLTIGVTSDPTFMLRNFIRDTLHTWTISRGDFTPVISSLTGAIKAFREDDDMVQLMAAGGAFHGGFAYGNDPAAVKLMVRKLITKKGIDRNTILDTVKKVWEAYQEIGSAMENAARVQTYANAKAKTGSHLQAAFDAKDIMDFSMRGDWAAINFLVQTVPFLGARIQGLQRLGKGAMENPVAFTLKGSAIALASTLLWLHNSMRPEYQELEEWDKDTYFHFFVGKKHFRLPKPFEVGAIFGTMPERLMELTLEKQHDGGLFFERMMAILTQTFAVGLPQILNEPMQQWANKDFFTGREIVGRDLQRLLPGEQSNPYTSATAKELGRAVHMSPRRLEHAVKGYFGALGMYCMGASDILVRKLWDYPSEPATKPEDWPVLSAFYRGEGPARNTKYTTEFYELLREADQLTDTIQRLRETGEVPRADKLIEKNLPKLAAGGILGQAQSELSKINKQMKRVHLDRSMSPDEKKEQLVELQRIKNDITRGVVGQAKAAMD